MAISTQPASILLGVIVDVSSSMQKNWNNHDGQKIAQAEVMRNVLNKRISEFQRYLWDAEEVDDTEIFCLGMGFKTVMHTNDKDVSYQQEHGMGPTVKTVTVHHLVCDLLALADLVPSREKLGDLQARLNERWQSYAKDIIERSIIREAIEEQLKYHLHQQMYQSATQKLQRSWQFKLAQIDQNNRLPDWLVRYMHTYIRRKKKKIATISFNDSEKYVDDIVSSTKKNFKKNIAQYIDIIRKCLEDFVESYTLSTLKALTLGFNVSELADDLNKEKAMMLVTQVQSELEIEVKNSIKFIMTKHLGQLEVAKLSIGAHISHQKVRDLTERCIAKYGWNIIRPLIEKTIYTIFIEKFEEQIKQSVPYWIQLASMREVTRSVQQLTTVFPFIGIEHSMRDEIMAGGTPFAQALDKAAIRFIDPQYQGREKVLIIISDGEFLESSSVVQTASLLKKRGVKIISCVVSNYDLRTRFLKQSPRNWPDGARQMLEIASDQDRDNPLTHKHTLNLLMKNFAYKLITLLL